MPLIVEDGSGLTDADAYVSVAEADAYNLSSANSAAWTAATTSAKELAIRQGTAYLDNLYRLRWLGRRFSDSQALSWPRAFVVDEDGFAIAAYFIPTRLKRATVEAAIRALAGSLMADLADPGMVSRVRKKVGPIETETEYVGGNSPIPEYRVIRHLLKGLIHDSGRMERG